MAGDSNQKIRQGAIDSFFGFVKIRFVAVIFHIHNCNFRIAAKRANENRRKAGSPCAAFGRAEGTA